MPIWQHRQEILEAFENNRVIVVESPTGSGKTTQIPLILHEAGYSSRGIIGITQPRRIAAVSVSEYMLTQIRRNDRSIAYTIRFYDTTDKSTIIKVMTDGILLQEMSTNKSLWEYNTIIIDEAHERTLNIDFILGLMKRLIKERSDLRVLVSSATINAAQFSNYFNSCPILHIDAPSYPVDVIYRPISGFVDFDSLGDAVCDIIKERIDKNLEGDILVFLHGEKAIKECVKKLEEQSYASKLLLRPLYARLAKEIQDQVFTPAPKNKIKVVVSTNIAETSITIDGITAVIDSGIAKMNFYNSSTSTSALLERMVSKASANQRLGRAGRTRPGICYRLYSRENYKNRNAYTSPEISHTDLSEVVLRMAENGITNFEDFDFLSPPKKSDLHNAVNTLRMMGVLKKDNSLTSIGSTMTKFPLLPRHSRMIVEAINRYPEVIEETVIATSFLTTNRPFLLPMGEEQEARRAHRKFQHPLGDFISYLLIFEAYEAARNKKQFCITNYFDPVIMHEIYQIKYQLLDIVSGLGIPITQQKKKRGRNRNAAPSRNWKQYLCTVAAGLHQLICKRMRAPNTYQSLTAERIRIHPGSTMYNMNPEFIVAGEIVKTSRMYAYTVSELKSDWLQEIDPNLSKNMQKVLRSPPSGRHFHKKGHSSHKRRRYNHSKTDHKKRS